MAQYAHCRRAGGGPPALRSTALRFGRERRQIRVLTNSSADVAYPAPSASLSLSTSDAVTLGERRLRRTSCKPLRDSVTSARSAACRTNSLTASPSVMR
jgi:hypothetical protein